MATVVPPTNAGQMKHLERFLKLAADAVGLIVRGERNVLEIEWILNELRLFKNPCRPAGSPTGAYHGYPHLEHYDEEGRPSFGSDQIRTLCELYPGLRVLRHHGCGNDPIHFTAPLTIASNPYQKNGDWRIDVRQEANHVVEMSLADCSVTPYLWAPPGSPQRWNERNWISRISE